MKTGSINLATVRFVNGVIPSKGRFTIELMSEDLSAETTFNVQISASGDNYANAQESGADIEGTIANSTATVKTYEGNPGDRFKILFAGATTGNVSYVINGL